VGCLSGAVSASGNDVLKGTEVNDIEGAVTKYYQENPLQDVFDAASNVYLQLRMKKIK
jgi:hypothetical protein